MRLSGQLKWALAGWVLFATWLNAEPVGTNLDGSAKGRLPHVFMIGDSTMADKRERAYPEMGWGQALPRLLSNEVVVANHAVNGRSSKSFRDEGRWEPVLSALKSGDFVIIQFGHNDEKAHDSSRYAASWGDYSDNLRRYVQEAQGKGAHPILATPICRRKFDESGRWAPTHGEYPDAVRALAKELDTPLVDLQALTRELLEELGPAESIPLFLHVVPGVYPGYVDGKIDDTHLVEMGALKVAHLFLETLSMQEHPLSNYRK